MAFTIIKKLFPIKTSSLDDFIKVIGIKRGKKVKAEPQVSEQGGAFTAAVGYIGTYEYSVLFSSQTLDRRPIVFREEYGSRFGSERGFADAETRERAVFQVLVTADDRLKKIREKLPDVVTELIGPEGAMDKQSRQDIHQYATENNITPF